jgi:energy-coupling factor transporter transmembrane protein EcfT
MTPTGIVNLLSALYLSAVICFAISLNENRAPARIVREALRRWVKFMLVAVAIGLVVQLIG